MTVKIIEPDGIEHEVPDDTLVAYKIVVGKPQLHFWIVINDPEFGFQSYEEAHDFYIQKPHQFPGIKFCKATNTVNFDWHVNTELEHDATG